MSTAEADVVHACSLHHFLVLTSAFLPMFEALLVHLIAVQPDIFGQKKGTGAVAEHVRIQAWVLRCQVLVCDCCRCVTRRAFR